MKYAVQLAKRWSISFLWRVKVVGDNKTINSVLTPQRVEGNLTDEDFKIKFEINAQKILNLFKHNML